jgi:peroxiredoxin Q/BCP
MRVMTDTDSGLDTAPVRLAPGDPAPEFTLPDADGNPVSLADHRGRRVIVYCYPGGDDPGLHHAGRRLHRRRR